MDNIEEYLRSQRPEMIGSCRSEWKKALVKAKIHVLNEKRRKWWCEVVRMKWKGIYIELMQKNKIFGDIIDYDETCF